MIFLMHEISVAFLLLKPLTSKIWYGWLFALQGAAEPCCSHWCALLYTRIDCETWTMPSSSPWSQVSFEPHCTLILRLFFESRCFFVFVSFVFIFFTGLRWRNAEHIELSLPLNDSGRCNSALSITALPAEVSADPTDPPSAELQSSLRLRVG